LERILLTEEKRKELVKKLTEKFGLSGQPFKCPMCAGPSFEIADGYFNNQLQNNLSSITIGGPSIPTIGIVCTRCGFLSQHALGIVDAPPNDIEGKT